MGCLASKPHGGAKYSLGEEDERVTAVRPSGKKDSERKSGESKKGSSIAGPTSAAGQIKAVRPKLDPKDFRFVGCRNEVKVKAPGSINGQAFMIDDCQDCDLYVLDNCAQVTIDGCKNCRIFLGPTAGSIFLRDSSNVKCAFLTRQLRLRGVTGADIALLCRTQPIVEESNSIAFTCYDMGYPCLPGQMKAARLDFLHNFWWHIYDFTPKEGNWKVMPTHAPTHQLLDPIPQEVQDAMSTPATTEDAQGTVVVTAGPAPAGSPPSPAAYLLAMFPCDTADKEAREFASKTVAQLGGVVLTTNKSDVGGDIKSMIKQAAWIGDNGQQQSKALTGAVIGIEISVADVEAKKKVVEAAGQSKQTSKLSAHYNSAETVACFIRMRTLHADVVRAASGVV